MPTEIKVWEIEGGALVEADQKAFEEHHKEAELEAWIARKPDLLGEELLIIGRQIEIPNVGRLDLLCIDSEGRLAIVELKRGMAPREAVAQALDYASWLDRESPDKIAQIAKTYLGGQDLDEAFSDRFGKELLDLDVQEHRTIIVAPDLDDSAERIINYLAQRHGVMINAVFFNFRRLSGGKDILVQSVLVPQSIVTPPTRRTPTEAELLAMSVENGTRDIVEACRGVRSFPWDERRSGLAGGSFRYWAVAADGANRMVFGVSLSGKWGAPPGKLDTWLRTEPLAEVTGKTKEEVEERLPRRFQVRDPGGQVNFVIQLANVKEAQEPVQELRALLAPAHS